MKKRLTPTQVVEIRDLLLSDLLGTHTELASIYKVSLSAIQRIVDDIVRMARKRR